MLSCFVSLNTYLRKHRFVSNNQMYNMTATPVTPGYLSIQPVTVQAMHVLTTIDDYVIWWRGNIKQGTNFKLTSQKLWHRWIQQRLANIEIIDLKKAPFHYLTRRSWAVTQRSTKNSNSLHEDSDILSSSNCIFKTGRYCLSKGPVVHARSIVILGKQLGIL